MSKASEIEDFFGGIGAQRAPAVNSFLKELFKKGRSPELSGAEQTQANTFLQTLGRQTVAPILTRKDFVAELSASKFDGFVTELTGKMRKHTAQQMYLGFTEAMTKLFGTHQLEAGITKAFERLDVAKTAFKLNSGLLEGLKGGKRTADERARLTSLRDNAAKQIDQQEAYILGQTRDFYRSIQAPRVAAAVGTAFTSGRDPGSALAGLNPTARGIAKEVVSEKGKGTPSSLTSAAPSHGPTGLFSSFLGDIFLLTEMAQVTTSIGKGLGTAFLGANAQLEQFLTTLTSTLGTAEKAQTAFQGFALPFALKVPFFTSQDLIGTINKLAAEGFSLPQITGNLDRKNGPQFQGSLAKTITNLAAAFGRTPEEATDAIIAASQNRFQKIRQFGISREDAKSFGFSGSAADSAGAVNAIRQIADIRLGGTVDRLGKTFKGASSNLEDFFQSSVRLATSSSFETVRQYLVKLTETTSTLGNAFGTGEGASSSAQNFAKYLKDDVGGALDSITKRGLGVLNFLARFRVQILAATGLLLAPFIAGRVAQAARIIGSSPARIGGKSFAVQAAKTFLADRLQFAPVANEVFSAEGISNGASLRRLLSTSVKGALDARKAKGLELAAEGVKLSAISPSVAGLNIAAAAVKNFGGAFDGLQTGITFFREMSTEMLKFARIAGGIFNFALVNSIFDIIGAFDDLRRGIRDTGRVKELGVFTENLRTFEQTTLKILSNVGKAFGHTFGTFAEEGPFLQLTNVFLTFGNEAFKAVEKVTRGFAVMGATLNTPIELLGKVVKLTEGIDKSLGGNGGIGKLVGVGALGLGATALLSNPAAASAIVSQPAAAAAIAALVITGLFKYAQSQNEPSPDAFEEIARRNAGAALIGNNEDTPTRAGIRFASSGASNLLSAGGLLGAVYVNQRLFNEGFNARPLTAEEIAADRARPQVSARESLRGFSDRARRTFDTVFRPGRIPNTTSGSSGIGQAEEEALFAKFSETFTPAPNSLLDDLAAQNVAARRAAQQEAVAKAKRAAARYAAKGRAIGRSALSAFDELAPYTPEKLRITQLTPLDFDALEAAAAERSNAVAARLRAESGLPPIGSRGAVRLSFGKGSPTPQSVKNAINQAVQLRMPGGEVTQLPASPDGSVKLRFSNPNAASFEPTEVRFAKFSGIPFQTSFDIPRIARATGPIFQGPLRVPGPVSRIGQLLARTTIIPRVPTPGAQTGSPLGGQLGDKLAAFRGEGTPPTLPSFLDSVGGRAVRNADINAFLRSRPAPTVLGRVSSFVADQLRNPFPTVSAIANFKPFDFSKDITLSTKTGFGRDGIFREGRDIFRVNLKEQAGRFTDFLAKSRAEAAARAETRAAINAKALEAEALKTAVFDEIRGTTSTTGTPGIFSRLGGVFAPGEGNFGARLASRVPALKNVSFQPLSKLFKDVGASVKGSTNTVRALSGLGKLAGAAAQYLGPLLDIGAFATERISDASIQGVNAQDTAQRRLFAQAQREHGGVLGSFSNTAGIALSAPITAPLTTASIGAMAIPGIGIPIGLAGLAAAGQIAAFTSDQVRNVDEQLGRAGFGAFAGKIDPTAFNQIFAGVDSKTKGKIRTSVGDTDLFKFLKSGDIAGATPGLEDLKKILEERKTEIKAQIAESVSPSQGLKDDLDAVYEQIDRVTNAMNGLGFVTGHIKLPDNFQAALEKSAATAETAAKKVKDLEDQRAKEELKFSALDTQITAATFTGATGAGSANKLRDQKEELRKQAASGQIERFIAFTKEAGVLSDLVVKGQAQVEALRKTKAVAIGRGTQFANSLITESRANGGLGITDADTISTLKVLNDNLFTAPDKDKRSQATVALINKLTKLGFSGSERNAYLDQLYAPAEAATSAMFQSNALEASLTGIQGQASNALTQATIEREAFLTGISARLEKSKARSDAYNSFLAPGAGLNASAQTPAERITELLDVKKQAEAFPGYALTDEGLAQLAQIDKELTAFRDVLRGRTQDAKAMNEALSDTTYLIDRIGKSSNQLKSLTLGDELAGSVQQARVLTGLFEAALPGTDQYKQLLDQQNEAIGKIITSYQNLQEARQKDLDTLREISDLQEKFSLDIKGSGEIAAILNQLPTTTIRPTIEGTVAAQADAQATLQAAQNRQERLDFERQTLEYNQAQEKRRNAIEDQNRNFNELSAKRREASAFFNKPELLSATTDQVSALNTANTQKYIEIALAADERRAALQKQQVDLTNKKLTAEKSLLDITREQEKLGREIAQRDTQRDVKNISLARQNQIAVSNGQELSPQQEERFRIADLVQKSRGILTLAKAGGKKEELQAATEDAQAALIDILRNNPALGNLDIPITNFSPEDRVAAGLVRRSAENIKAGQGAIQTRQYDTTADEREIALARQKQLFLEDLKNTNEALDANKKEQLKAATTLDDTKKILGTEQFSKIQADYIAKNPEARSVLATSGLTSDQVFTQATYSFKAAVDRFAAAVGFNNRDVTDSILTPEQRAIQSATSPTTTGLGKGPGAVSIAPGLAKFKATAAAPLNAFVEHGANPNGLDIHMRQVATDAVRSQDPQAKKSADLIAQNNQELAKQTTHLEKIAQGIIAQARQGAEKQLPQSLEGLYERMGQLVLAVQELLSVKSAGDSAQEGVLAGIPTRTAPVAGFALGR